MTDIRTPTAPPPSPQHHPHAVSGLSRRAFIIVVAGLVSLAVGGLAYGAMTSSAPAIRGSTRDSYRHPADVAVAVLRSIETLDCALYRTTVDPSLAPYVYCPEGDRWTGRTYTVESAADRPDAPGQIVWVSASGADLPLMTMRVVTRQYPDGSWRAVDHEFIGP